MMYLRESGNKKEEKPFSGGGGGFRGIILFLMPISRNSLCEFDMFKTPGEEGVRTPVSNFSYAFNSQITTQESPL